MMMIWRPDLEKLKNSALDHYTSKYMTSPIEAIRVLSRRVGERGFTTLG